MKDRYCQARFIVWLCQISIAIFMSFDSSLAQPPLTDEQKKLTIQGLYQNYKEAFPAVADISAQAAIRRFRAGEAIFIDTRTREERDVSMLPDAVAADAFLIDPLIASGKQAIAYCTIGYRSGVFAREMAQQGIEVINLSGGILAWAWAGGPLVEQNTKTTRIHVVGKKWNYVPAGYEAVMFGFWDSLFKY